MAATIETAEPGAREMEGVAPAVQPSRVRVPELDAIRGIAALVIVIYHLRAYWVPWGWAAVDLFFVLSGFLITSIILQNLGHKGFLRTFYLRRSLRIWPIYYLTILVLVMGNRWLPNPYELAEALPYYLSYTQNVQRYWGAASPGVRPLGHTWSLAVEEQFYLCWPIALVMLGRQRVLLLAITVAAAAFAGRALGFSLHIMLTRCDGFALGAILASLLEKSRHDGAIREKTKTICMAGGLTAAVYLMIGTTFFGPRPFFGTSEVPDVPIWPAVTMLMINLLCASGIGLVAIHAGHDALKPLRSPALCYLGTISYGLYLYHWVILDLKRQYGFELIGPRITAGAILLASLMTAVISWRFVERPILSMNRFLSYTRTNGSDATCGLK